MRREIGIGNGLQKPINTRIRFFIIVLWNESMSVDWILTMDVTSHEKGWYVTSFQIGIKHVWMGNQKQRERERVGYQCIICFRWNRSQTRKSCNRIQNMPSMNCPLSRMLYSEIIHFKAVILHHFDRIDICKIVNRSNHTFIENICPKKGKIHFVGSSISFGFHWIASLAPDTIFIHTIEIYIIYRYI